jgi:hypothetical protein
VNLLKSARSRQARHKTKTKKGHQTKEASERTSEISFVWGRLQNKRRKKQTKKEKTVLSNDKGFVPESGR